MRPYRTIGLNELSTVCHHTERLYSSKSSAVKNAIGHVVCKNLEWGFQWEINCVRTSVGSGIRALGLEFEGRVCPKTSWGLTGTDSGKRHKCFVGHNMI